MVGMRRRGSGNGKQGGSGRRAGGRAVLSIALLLFLATTAPAEEPGPRKFDLSAAVRHSFPFGSEEAGVEWSDLYDPGSGGALEIGYRVQPRWALYFGGAYDHYPAKEVILPTPVGTVSGRFNDQKLLTLYLGMKGYLLGAEFPQKSAGIDPYLRADLGVTQFNGADFNGLSVAKRSRAFSFSVGLGADVLTYTNFIFFFEGRYEDHGTPDQAGNAFRAIPLSMGLRYLL